LNFGTRDLLQTAIDVSNTLSLSCTNGQPYTFGLNGGTSNASDPAQRKMSQGAQSITYGLYRDATRTLPWGNTSGVDTASGTGTGTTQNFTVYGRVPSQNTPAAGTYTDTVVVTVTY
jgi:spore coat protein U-like protein